MPYTVLAEGSQLTKPLKIKKETAGEALAFHLANLKTFGRSRVQDEDGHEVDQSELIRRAQRDSLTALRPKEGGRPAMSNSGSRGPHEKSGV